jgi:hypothetical protein
MHGHIGNDPLYGGLGGEFTYVNVLQLRVRALD